MKTHNRNFGSEVRIFSPSKYNIALMFPSKSSSVTSSVGDITVPRVKRRSGVIAENGTITKGATCLP